MTQRNEANITAALSHINDVTGFMNGDKFTSPEQVREYFTVDNLREMFGEEAPAVAQFTLDNWAEFVIEERAHCAF